MSHPIRSDRSGTVSQLSSPSPEKVRHRSKTHSSKLRSSHKPKKPTGVKASRSDRAPESRSKSKTLRSSRGSGSRIRRQTKVTVYRPPHKVRGKSSKVVSEDAPKVEKGPERPRRVRHRRGKPLSEIDRKKVVSGLKSRKKDKTMERMKGRQQRLDRMRSKSEFLLRGHRERKGGMSKSTLEKAVDVKEMGFDTSKGFGRTAKLPVDVLAKYNEGRTSGGERHLSSQEYLKGGFTIGDCVISLGAAIAQTVRVHEMNKDEKTAKEVLSQFDQVKKDVVERDELVKKEAIAGSKLRKLFKIREKRPLSRGENRALRRAKRDLIRCKSRIQEIDAKPGVKKLHTMALKAFLAEKTLQTDKSGWDRKIHLERGKCASAWLSVPRYAIDIARYTTVMRTGTANVLKGVSGGAAGVLGIIGAGLDFKAMIDSSRDAHKLIEKRDKFHKVRTDRKGSKDRTMEMLAKRLEMKASKNRTTKIMSALKYASGTLGGLGSAFAGTVSMAGVIMGSSLAIASVATPVGWALGGLAALGLIGYGLYRLGRHIRSKGVKTKIENGLKALDQLDGGKRPHELSKDLKKGLEFIKAKGRKHGVETRSVSRLKSRSEINGRRLENRAALREFALDYRLSRDTRTASATAMLMLREAFKAVNPDGHISETDVANSDAPVVKLLKDLGADDKFISNLVGALRETPGDISLAQKAFSKKFGLR